MGMHFMPKAEISTGLSVLEEHSVALFRYQFTAPAELFDLALHFPDSWGPGIDKMATYFEGAALYRPQVPIKVASVRERYMPDLLTRFTIMFNRIGSADFSKIAVEKLIEGMS